MGNSALRKEASPELSDWHLKLFEKSLLKQEKWRQLSSAFGDVSLEENYLDLGSDNGLISFLFRQEGGQWSSADLEEGAVESIRSLVGERVHLIDGVELPFADNFFTKIVIVDMLEHVEDDRALLKEIARVLKPGGALVLNVPNKKTYSPLRAFRHLIGQTDEAHGHLRPGYSRADLVEVLKPEFELLETHTYSRFFTEAIDTAIVFSYSLFAKKNTNKGPSKGLVLTGPQLQKMKRQFALYSAIYPLVAAVSFLDKLIPVIPGFMRLAIAVRREERF